MAASWSGVKISQKKLWRPWKPGGWKCNNEAAIRADRKSGGSEERRKPEIINFRKLNLVWRLYLRQWKSDEWLVKKKPVLFEESEAWLFRTRREGIWRLWPEAWLFRLKTYGGSATMTIRNEIHYLKWPWSPLSSKVKLLSKPYSVCQPDLTPKKYIQWLIILPSREKYS